MSSRSLAVTAALIVSTALFACSSPSTRTPGTGTLPATPCTLPPAPSLQVLEATPAMFAADVSVNAPVRLRFNTCLDLKTIDAITFDRFMGGAVGYATTYDGATSTLTLQPAAPLAYGADYDVAMGSGLRGAAGETIMASWLLATTFTTRGAPERVPPTTTADPAGGHYNHALDVTLTCVDDVGGVGCAATHFTLDGSAPGPSSPTYTAPIHLTADATLRFASVDLDGNWEAPITAIYVFDLVPPSVVSFQPADLAEEVPLDTAVVVSFDEEMDPASLASALASTPLMGAQLAWDAATRTATWRPERPLDCATTYALTLAGAKDLAQNVLPTVTRSFTTSADCAPPVTTASPGDGTYAAPQAVTLSCADGAGTGCARIVYTTDGSVPSPTKGTVVTGLSAGPIPVGQGETVLRFYAVDVAGNREPTREERYGVSSSGFWWVATGEGLARGAGPVPDRFHTRRNLGTTSAFFRDPTNGRLWRATDRSVVFSDDGVTWTACPQILDSYSMMLPITAIWANGAFVLAGTREGLYGSLDGGMTWRVWLRWMVDYYTVAWPTDVDGAGKDVFVATTHGLAISHDSGRSWTWHGMYTQFNDVAFDPATGQVYAASVTGLHVSGDRGATFSRWDGLSTPRLPSNLVRSVAVTADTIHLATDAGYVRMGRGADGQPTSATVLAPPCPSGDPNVWRVAASPALVAVATGYYFTGTSSSFCVSTNGGASFTARRFFPDSDSAIAGSLLVEGSSVYVGYTPGWYLSTDGAASFALKELPTGIADVAAANGTLFAATEKGLAVSTDGFRSFVVRRKSDGLRDDWVRKVAASGTRVYATSSWGLSLSSDGGTTFSVFPAGTFVNAPKSLAVEGTTVFAGAEPALFRSTNAGGTFSKVLPSGGSPNLGGSLAVAVRGSTVVVADNATVWVSSDGGATFVQRGAADGLVPYGSYLSIEDVAIDGTGAIWAASNGGAYVSTDGGVTFGRPASGDLSPGTWLYGVDAGGGAVCLAATEGVAITTDGGATVAWRRSAEGIGGARSSVYVP